MFKNSKVFVVGPLNGEEASDGMAIHGPRRAQGTPPGPWQLKTRFRTAHPALRLPVEV